MAAYLTTLCLLLISIFTLNVSASCMRSALVSQTTKYGTIDQYCVHNDLHILPGSSFKISSPECLDCKCTTDGLQCCGYGFAAGVVVPPEGCVAYNDACQIIFVKKDNPDEICHQPKGVRKSKGNRKVPTNRRKTVA